MLTRGAISNGLKMPFCAHSRIAFATKSRIALRVTAMRWHVHVRRSVVHFVNMSRGAGGTGAIGLSAGLRARRKSEYHRQKRDNYQTAEMSQRTSLAPSLRRDQHCQHYHESIFCRAANGYRRRPSIGRTRGFAWLVWR